MTPGQSNQPSDIEAPRHALQWRLHAVMSDRGIRTVRELHRRLREQGVDVTHRHLARVVSHLPERLSTQLLLALMMELNCKADELLRVARRVPRVRESGSAVTSASTRSAAAIQDGRAVPTSRPEQAEVAEEPDPSASLCGPDMGSLVLHIEDEEA